jgi:hypothetical protein
MQSSPLSRIDFSHGRAVGYASPDSVWANIVKGKDTLRALPGVETPSTRRTEWRHTGGTNA